MVSQKVGHHSRPYSFVKSSPIFTILLLLEKLLNFH